MKRSFECVIAAGSLLLLSPLLAATAMLVLLTSPGPILFRQERIGCGFQRFRILKFRSMVTDAINPGAVITVGDDPRITSVGRLLRKTKIDELPQLYNVLKGEMSLVGPRPEVPKYVELYRKEYESILQVRPGITDLASIAFRDEAALLAAAEDPEQEYIHHILPIKIKLAKQYVRQQSLWLDLRIICLTVMKLMGDRFTSARSEIRHHFIEATKADL